MSILSVANVIFESTGANRIEYTGNNVIRVKGAGLQLPVVTNATKPSAEPGMMLYNSDTGNMEMMGAGGAGLSFASNSSVASVFAVANAGFDLANTSMVVKARESSYNLNTTTTGTSAYLKWLDGGGSPRGTPGNTAGSIDSTGQAATTSGLLLEYDALYNGATAGLWKLQMYHNTAGGYPLWFRTQANGGWQNWNSLVHANYLGNVGIGTNSPSQKLEVVGNAKISPSLNGGLLIHENGGSIQGFLGPSGFGGFAIGTQSSNNVIFFSNNSERMRIDTNGNVGVGRTPGGGYKLDVVGTANVSSLHVVSQYATANTNHVVGAQTHCIARYFQPGTYSTFYVHCLLPARYNNTSSKMFLLEFKGYEFSTPAIMNILIGAYVTPVNNGGPISKIAAWDATSRYSPTVYYSNTYNVGVARLTIPASGSYYLSFSVNHICVGNGDILEPGELTIIESASATL